MGFGTELEIRKDDVENPDDYIPLVLEDVKLYLPLSDLIDKEEERARLEKEKEKLEKEIERAEKKLANEGFVKKAPEQVVEERKKLEGYQSMYREVCDSLNNL